MELSASGPESFIASRRYQNAKLEIDSKRTRIGSSARESQTRIFSVFTCPFVCADGAFHPRDTLHLSLCGGFHLASHPGCLDEFVALTICAFFAESADSGGIWGRHGNRTSYINPVKG